jgi:hypothetical protein
MELKLEFVTGQDKDGEDIVEEKTFVTNKIKSRLTRRALEVRQEITSNPEPTPELLDILVDFACEVYKHKFTRDDLYDGLDAEVLFPTLTGTVGKVINGVTSKLETFPPVE